MQGIGIYIRQITQKTYGTPSQAARKCQEHGVSFVSILTVWQEAEAKKTKVLNKPQSSKFREYVQAFKEHDIKVLLWGYPWAGKENGFIIRMQQAMDVVPGLVDGLMLDPELGYKWDKNNKSETVTRGCADYLVESTLDCCNESMDIWVTSHGQPKIHNTLPWNEFTVSFGSPQFYTVGKNAILAGLKQWHDLGFLELLPSVPAYGKYSGENLENYLRFFPKDLIKGFIVWSWPQMKEVEWKTVERWALKFL